VFGNGIERSCWVGFLLLCGCGSSPTPSASEFAATHEDLLDPQTCKTCHEQQFDDWSGSMHAYASDDPLFLAMNQRGQREAQLGDFCVKCHAPVALSEGKTTDGLNLSGLSPSLKGVTCFFCHSVDDVQGTHDNPLHLSSDARMRGEITDPVKNAVHASAYSPLHDRSQLGSSNLCGSCHDIVNGHGAALERTYSEWQESVFSHAPGGSTCGQCHMDQSKALQPVAPGGPPRRSHAHSLPGVDLALTEFPQIDAQKQLVQDSLDTTLQSALCVSGIAPAQWLTVILDNVSAGHHWPSGATQDRRAWVEVNAYQGDHVIYQSGAVEPDGSGASDADLWLLKDCMFDAAKRPVRMFWEAATSAGNLLPGQLTFDMSDVRFYQTHIYRRFPLVDQLPAAPDRVTLQVHLSAVAPEVIDDLIASGDLEARYRGAVPSLLVGKPLEWTAATVTEQFVDATVPTSCVSQGGLRATADKVAATALPAGCSP